MNRLKMQFQSSKEPYSKVLSLIRYLSIAFLCFAITSCQDESGTGKEDVKLYFDLKGFIGNQVIYLNDKKPEITKTAALGKRKEVLKSRNVDWKKELELFVQADLNKPSYRQSYEVIRPDSSHYEYRLKANADLPVKYLKITIDTTLKQPVYVEALLVARNKIYSSEKKIKLQSVRKDNLLEIGSYSIEGYQKLVFMETKPFTIAGKIGL